MCLHVYVCAGSTLNVFIKLCCMLNLHFTSISLHVCVYRIKSYEHGFAFEHKSAPVVIRYSSTHTHKHARIEETSFVVAVLWWHFESLTSLQKEKKLTHPEVTTKYDKWELRINKAYICFECVWFWTQSVYVVFVMLKPKNKNKLNLLVRQMGNV